MNFDNSVKNNEFFSLNQCEVTVEIHIKLRNDLSNIESENAIIDNLSIHTTLIISVMNVMVRNQIRAQMWIGGSLHLKFSETRHFG